MPECLKSSSVSPEEELCARFEIAVPRNVNSTPHLVWRWRNLSADCVVQIGATSFLLRIEQSGIRQ